MSYNNHTITQPLVERLRQRGELSDARIEAAFASVPRHIFLPDAPLEDVYSDKAVDVLVDERGQVVCSSVMPSVLAYALRQANLFEGANVLEIGAGTGYSAALIRQLVGENGHVTTLEIDRDIVEMARANLQRADTIGVNVVHADGTHGYAPRAAYDRIIATVGVWDVPPVWLRQLKPGGLLIAPIWLDGLQVIATFTQQPDGTLYSAQNMSGAFVYLRGEAAGPAVRKQIGSTSLALLTDAADRLDSAAIHMLLSDDYDRCRLSESLASDEYWYGFLPYLMLNEPRYDIFALYLVKDNHTAYGVEGTGFALFSAGSACFVPYFGLGDTHCFAGAEAFLTVEDILHKWSQNGRPGLDTLRLRLIPNNAERSPIAQGKLYPRRDHALHVWQEATHDNA